MSGHLWAVSYFRDLVLDFGVRPRPSLWQYRPVDEKSKSLRLLRASDHQLISAIKADAHWTDADCTQTPSWEDTFIVSLCVFGDDKKVQILPVWKIFGDGHTERTDIHVDDLLAPKLVPFRHGYFLVTWGSNKEGPNEKDAGIYAVSGGTPKRILAGFYRTLAISPNGCLGAFSKVTRFQFASDREHPIILDLCKAAGG
jgi:hypothetical protein